MRIGNCSGFYGDRLSAMREMLEGGRLDVLTGDYLAELTMLILGRDQLRDPSGGYAKTFLRQAAECWSLAQEKGVKLVSNAGGLNPAGLAAELTRVGARVAYVTGDAVSVPGALTANAYLGAFGIARALESGADVVVTGRVTDASLVVGPAIAEFGWKPSDLDELAGAVVAGHILECGTQATGGNFSGFQPWDQPLGFPLAEIAADGSFVVTKHPGTGGEVTVDTVTAQLMYEIQGPLYVGPDVTTDLRTIRLAQDGPDRVAVSGVRGTPPPPTLKVAVNELGGFRNSAEFVLTGLDIDAKAAWLRSQVEPTLASVEHSWSTHRLPAPDSPTEEGASVLLRLTAWSPEEAALGKAFTEPLIALALASYPGFHVTAPPTRPSPYGVYRAEYVDRAAVTHTVVLPDGSTEVIADPRHPEIDEGALTPDSEPRGAGFEARFARTSTGDGPARTSTGEGPARTSTGDGPARTSTGDGPARASTGDGPARASTTERRALGELVYARSGDKGGDANLGLWVPAGRSNEAVDWLIGLITPETVKQLVPEAGEVEIHPLPNLRGVNVILKGLLGAGVAEGRRFDPQAKGLGEWVRSRHVDIPKELLA